MEVVKLLLRCHGIDANVRVPGPKEGATPLHAASQNGHVAIVKRLLQEPNVDVEAKDKDGTPFCFGFNLGTCTHQCQPGQKCPKGLHKCCYEGCGANHPLKGNH